MGFVKDMTSRVNGLSYDRKCPSCNRIAIIKKHPAIGMANLAGSCGFKCKNCDVQLYIGTTQQGHVLATQEYVDRKGK